MNYSRSVMNTLFTGSVLDILFKDGRISIWSDGLCILAGNIENMALALIEYSVREANGALNITYNHCLEVNFEKEVINWVSTTYDKPDRWDQLSEEVQRVWKLKAFW